jgi:geranylgeranyl diphosphate synthase type I
MLIGEYHHTLDDKGRVSIPVKVRVACESGAILTRGLDHSLVVFPRDAWQAFVAGLQTLPWQQAETRALVRLFLAGASEDRLTKIKQFGTDLGIAFQIQDDILGIFGDEHTLGKSVTSDIEEGKNTLLITEAYKNANNEQKQILDKYYGSGEVSSEHLEQIKHVFIETGALEYSKNMASQYVESAKKLIPELTKSEDHRHLLSEMSEFLVNRDK